MQGVGVNAVIDIEDHRTFLTGLLHRGMRASEQARNAYLTESDLRALAKLIHDIDHIRSESYKLALKTIGKSKR